MKKILSRRESDIYQDISHFMMIKYPDIIYRFDFAAGMKMTLNQAKNHKYLNPWSGYPDLFIAYPNGKHCGLFIEIKKKSVKVFKKDGRLYQDEHLERQFEVLNQLSFMGYHATFGIGLDHCIEIIDSYLRGEI